MEISTEERHRKLLALSYELALESPDPSTQLGAFVFSPIAGILGKGCNTFTKGWVPQEGDFERPRKYSLVCHAERNAIYHTARSTLMKTKGAWLVCFWAPCCECAWAIIESGITTVLRHKDAMDRTKDSPQWADNITLADSMLEAAGVHVIEYSGPIGTVEPIRHSGELWKP